MDARWAKGAAPPLPAGRRQLARKLYTPDTCFSRHETAPWRLCRGRPLHAFYQRTRIRRGHGKAIVATARKLAVLFWCMLTRNEDDAHQQPSLTRRKLRQLELTAGAPKYTRRAAGVWATNDHAPSRAGARPPGRNLLQAHRPRPKGRRTRQKSGGERDTGARIDSSHSQRGHKSRGRPQAPDVCASLRHRLAPNSNL